MGKGQGQGAMGNWQGARGNWQGAIANWQGARGKETENKCIVYKKIKRYKMRYKMRSKINGTESSKLTFGNCQLYIAAMGNWQ
jgi:hypothetical protein